MYAIDQTPPKYWIDIVESGAPLRPRLEAEIAARYQQEFDATLHHFMPYLVPLHDARGNLAALAGYTPAANSDLFLEQYLNQPIEQQIGSLMGHKVLRQEVVEIGQLASFTRGIAPIHFVALARLLAAQGFHWVVFTATGPLHRMMTRLGMMPKRLAAADRCRVKDPGSWGNYYQTKPRVLALSIDEAMAALRHIESEVEIPQLLREMV